MQLAAVSIYIITHNFHRNFSADINRIFVSAVQVLIEYIERQIDYVIIALSCPCKVVIHIMWRREFDNIVVVGSRNDAAAAALVNTGPATLSLSLAISYGFGNKRKWQPCKRKWVRARQRRGKKKWAAHTLVGRSFRHTLERQWDKTAVCVGAASGRAQFVKPQLSFVFSSTLIVVS